MNLLWDYYRLDKYLLDERVVFYENVDLMEIVNIDVHDVNGK